MLVYNSVLKGRLGIGMCGWRRCKAKIDAEVVGLNI